ncbi:MAG: nucleotide exchange factor GrpE [bacterium]|nr:nucleotide exchange factor GrpE [bacterium]
MTKKVDYRTVSEQLALELAEANEALLRERADAANVRRRADEDKLKMAGFYKTSVVRELLPVIDNFERALNHVPKDLEKNDYIKGVEGVVKQFQQVLDKLGVARIKTVGMPFNPELHEAVSAEGDGEHEIVSEELQSGWVLGSEVIRHAMVRVSNK